MKPGDLPAQLTPNELAAVREAVAVAIVEHPAWTRDAALSVAELIRAGDADDTRSMIIGLTAALAVKALRP